jgi:hypothetical protein
LPITCWLCVLPGVDEPLLPHAAIARAAVMLARGRVVLCVTAA